MMRMKESDDYITARAANPRTGLISPSVGSPTPNIPLAPESPAEALKLRDKAPSSPTPDVRARPTLRRANEGRKVSAGLRANEKGWLNGTISATSPRVAAAEASATGFPLPKTRLRDHDDQLVKMPTAQEPQPYAFPGFSAKQIEAYEHYKSKARKVSSEGYDHRILQAPRQDLHGADCAGKDEGGTLERSRQHTVGDLTSGAALNAANFAPFSSPRTPIIMGSDKVTSLKTLHTAEKLKIHRPIARKPIATGDAADLQSLPKVRLPHPSVAAVPHLRRQKALGAEIEPRKCSFGCVKDSENGVCVAASGTVTTAKQRVPLFEEATVSGAEREIGIENVDPSFDAFYWISNLLLDALVTLFELSKHINLPHVRLPVLEILRSEQAQPQEKMEAMKTIVYSTGQAPGLITAVIMMWSLGSILVHMLEILLWPVTVPFRILRWLASG